MCKWKNTLIVVGFTSAAFVAGRSFSPADAAYAQQSKDQPATIQPKDKDKATAPGKGTPDMEAMMKNMQPGPQHRVLEVMTGNWEGSIKFWMAPDQPPQESTGKVSREWALDGRFLEEKVTGDWMGTPFKGVGYLGYNTIDKKYESVWLENMATWITTADGKYDESGKTFTFTGDCIDPMTQKRTSGRHTINVSNPTKHIMTGYTVGPDGKEFKSFEGTFEKKS